jgi:hypothetical protein
MLGARFAGRSEDDVLPFAAAIEMIHTYSLVHDDLPAVDNAYLRRDKMTTHVMHGEAMAVFAGDALLNLAYEIMTDEVFATADFTRLQAMKIIMNASGINGLLNGQAKDISGGGAFFFEQIIEMYRNKTADLIRAALVSGALICGAKKDDIEALSRYADSLGIYFQLLDDLADKDEDGDGEPFKDDTVSASAGDAIGSIFDIGAAAEPETETGIGSDAISRLFGAGADGAARSDKRGDGSFGAAKKSKTTFLKVAGLAETQRTIEEYEAFITRAIESLGERAGELAGLFEYIKGLQ